MLENLKPAALNLARGVSIGSITLTQAREEIKSILHGPPIQKPVTILHTSEVDVGFVTACRDLIRAVAEATAEEEMAGRPINYEIHTMLIGDLTDAVTDNTIEVQDGDEVPDFPEVDGSDECSGEVRPTQEYLPSRDEVQELKDSVEPNSKGPSLVETRIYQRLQEAGLESRHIAQFCADLIELTTRPDFDLDEYFPEKSTGPSSKEDLERFVVFRSDIEEAERNRQKAISKNLEKTISEDENPDLVINIDEDADDSEEVEDLLGTPKYFQKKMDLPPMKATSLESPSDRASYGDNTKEAIKLLNKAQALQNQAMQLLLGD